MEDRRKLIKLIFEDSAKHRRCIKMVVDGYAISHSQCELMHILYRQHDLSIKEIADEMHVTCSAATQLVDAMVKENLLTRETDRRDRRSTNINLSPEGKKKFQDFQKKILRDLEKKLNTFTTEELNQAIYLRRKLMHAIEGK